MEHHQSHQLFIAYWLLACILCVFGMIVIGGLTRLTESGLSIVEWKLLSGILPPFSDIAWQQEFAAYQQTPEFIHKNHMMDLDGFKRIYWLEYIHRLLGRCIGLLLIVPFLLFSFPKKLPNWLSKRMLIIITLVGIQGTVGWYMVQSGLNDVPWVSPYRLAFHLGLAVIIFGLLVTTYYHYRQQLKNQEKHTRPKHSLLLSSTVIAGLFIQILMGAFVAGLDAGFTYNTFPLMDGDFFPAHAFALSPWYHNFFEHIPLVQFQHRWFAFIILGLMLWQHTHTMHHYQNTPLVRISWYILVTCGLQILLGIATLIHVVPISLATLHQAVAVILMALCLLWRQMLFYIDSPIVNTKKLEKAATPMDHTQALARGQR